MSNRFLQVSAEAQTNNIKIACPLYQRVEPRSRDDDFARGLEARWADPLWALARQYQMGEFKGEDTGSPIRVGFTRKTCRLDEIELEIPKKLRLSGPPLEALVEHQNIHRAEIEANWRLRVQIGQQFERLLHAEIVQAADCAKVICELRKRYPMKALKESDLKVIDRATQRFITVMAGRVIDGWRLLNATLNFGRITWDLPSGTYNGLDGSATAEKAAFARLKEWFECLHGEIAQAESAVWVKENLEYRFNVKADAGDGQLTLAAPSYSSGELDWYTFDIEGNPEIPSGGEEKDEEFVPTRVSFHGMPHPRWWAFEDSQTDFGKMDTAKTDLAKMMILNFAVNYGNDWFMIPLPVEVGTITRIDSLTVTDVFGVETEVHRARPERDAPLQAWQMFSLSQADNPNETGEFLFLPPTVSFSEESAPLEEVRFFRDEMANMVWAVEHTVRNGLGRPFGGFEAHVEQRAREQEDTLRQRLAELLDLKRQLLEQLGGQAVVPEKEPVQTRESLQTRVDELEEQIKQSQSGIASAGLAPQAGSSEEAETSLPKYRLASTVPPNWIPFVPVKLPSPDSQIALRRAEMTSNDEQGMPIQAITRLLEGVNGSGSLERLREEAVTRTGQKYQLTKQRVRWLDGKTFVWTGRKVVVGKGEGSNGLRFDLFY